MPVKVAFKAWVGVSVEQRVEMFLGSAVGDALAVVVSPGVPIGGGAEMS